MWHQRTVPQKSRQNLQNECAFIMLTYFFLIFHVAWFQWEIRCPCQINTLKHLNKYKPSVWRHFYLLIGGDRNTNSILLNSETFPDYKFAFSRGSYFETTCILATYYKSCTCRGNLPTSVLSVNEVCYYRFPGWKSQHGSSFTLDCWTNLFSWFSNVKIAPGAQ